MNKYFITVTNGQDEKIIELKKDGEWVKDINSAIKMAESKINWEWQVKYVEERKGL
jgi:hypothetical protein